MGLEGGAASTATLGARECRERLFCRSGDAWLSAWFLQSFYQAILGWYFHLSGPSVKCFPGPGPPPGTHAPITSGVASSACVPLDRMDMEAECGGTCPRSPCQGGTRTQASQSSFLLKACAPLALCTLLCTPHWYSQGAGTRQLWGPGRARRGWGGALGTSVVTEGPFPCPTQGRFTIAAKHHISIAEIYETELVDIEKVSGRWWPCLADGGEEPQQPVPSGWGASLLGLLCSLGSPLVSEYWKRGVEHWQNLHEGLRARPVVNSSRIATSLPSGPSLCLPQAIAHYEQSADYYKGEESNRYGAMGSLPLPSPALRPATRPLPTSLFSAHPAQLSQQVSAEGGRLRCTAGAISEGH